MSEVIEVAHLISESGVPVTVAATDVEHYLTVGFARPHDSAQPETESEAEPEQVEEAEEPAEPAEETADEPATAPKRGRGKK